MESIFRKLAILTILSLIVSALLIMPASAASKCKLVKEHKYKISYYKNGKWTSKGIKCYLAKYKYDKHNNLCAVTHQHRSTKSKKLKTDYVNRYKLTYKDGRLAKSTDEYDEGYSITAFQNGVPVRTEYSGWDFTGNREYTYKARYLKSMKNTYMDWESDSPSVETTEYDIRTKNGYPVKITKQKGAYSDEVVITFYTSGVKKGLVKKIVVKEYEDDEGPFLYKRSEYKYSFKMKKGSVKSYTLKIKEVYTNGPIKKYKQTGTFKYSKRKTRDKRYRSMINQVVDDGWSNEIRTYW